MNLSTTRWIPKEGVEPMRFAVINRGEAAVRFMRTARVWSRRHERPIELIAFYTDPDAKAPFVQMADTTISLGDPFRTDANGERTSSYLDVEGLIERCVEMGVDAIWPGWGFLGESPELSAACAQVGITFIGPTAEVMSLLGDKVRSKAFAQEHDVPVSPWSGGAISDPEEAVEVANDIGYPVILKAAAGGGGRGIRLVRSDAETREAFKSARAEAMSAFGDAAVFIEKYVEEARHVEVQLLADQHDTVWSLGTRDCSVQRRHQKILEETPAPNVDQAVLDEICAAARCMAAACGYLGAGTAEFLLLPDGETFYFLEMNARLQVEHTISECLYNIDLVDAQIDVAMGNPLPSKTPPEPRGAAIEARLNAEEPDMDFAPAGGKIHVFDFPGGPGVRVDSGFRVGDSVAGAFDSNLAKIIAHGRDRTEALARLEQALRDTRVVIEGGLTNRSMILEILTNEDFQNVEHSTRWLEGYLERRSSSLKRPFLAQSLMAAGLIDFVEDRRAEREDLFANVHAGPPQQLSSPEPAVYRYLVDGTPVWVEVGELGPRLFQVRSEGWSTLCEIDEISPRAVTFVARNQRYTALCARGASWVQINTLDVSHRFERVPDGRITADMAAVVTEINVEAGQSVTRGDRLITLEVMKMEIHVNAPMDGVIEAIHTNPSTQVSPGTTLLELVPTEAECEDVEEEVADVEEHLELPGDDEVPSAARIIRAGMLGYDIAEEDLQRTLGQLTQTHDLIDVSDVLDAMEALVVQHELFLDGPYDDALNAARESSAEQTIWFLLHQRLDEDWLSPKVLHRLKRLFVLHEIDGEEDALAIQEALFRLLQTHLRDVKRHEGLSILLDTLLARWGADEVAEEEVARAIPLLDHLVEITTQTGAHELTLRAQHLAHRLRGFEAGVSREAADEPTPMLDAALEHTVTLKDFELRPLPRVVNRRVRCALAKATEDDSDRRALAVASLEAFEPTRPEGGKEVWHCPHVDALLREAFDELRQTLLDHQFEGPWHWNRITLLLSPEIKNISSVKMMRVIEGLDTQQMEALGLEKLVVIWDPTEDSNAEGWKIELTPSHAWNGESTLTCLPLGDPAIQPQSKDDQRAIRARRRRQMPPEQLVSLMARAQSGGVTGPGSFTEYDLTSDGAGLEAVDDRHASAREANLMVGMLSHPHERFANGLERVVIVGDLTRTMGSLAEPECRRVNAALDLAQDKSLPVEWISFSSGARISFETGTENLDWTARTLRRIIEFTEAGGTIHILVDGPCVGAQSYWNAEATMLNHCRGALFMTPRGYMILTGKRALEHSGCVSASSNEAIGGLQIMAPNGEAQYIAPTLADAYDMLLNHYALTYIEPGQRYTRPHTTTDAVERDVTEAAYEAEVGDFTRVGEIFSDATNPGRKKPFDIRAVMRTVLDRDVQPLERWPELEGGESSVVYHGQLGGQPVCMIGIESMPMQRKGRAPTHGPSTWTSGTLYPQSSRKVARAIHASSGIKPVVVLANLSGFDGSPESLKNRQLEFGAEIGRAVVKFDGPIIFCVISRYHGGAYVVFSQGLHEDLEAIALEGTYASVIGGGPAAAVVFPRKVRRRVDADERIIEARAKREAGELDELEYDKLYRAVHAEIQGKVAKEFDNIHSVRRAKEVGSLTDIISPNKLRASLCARTAAAVERFLARERTS